MSQALDSSLWDLICMAISLILSLSKTFYAYGSFELSSFDIDFGYFEGELEKSFSVVT